MDKVLSIAEEIQRTAFKECIPISVTFEITLRCNIRCLHCYNFDRSEPHSNTNYKQELTPEEIYRIIDEVHQAGCLYLAFTGGEVLLHPHLHYFIKYARKKRLAVTVKTNGTLFTEAAVKGILDAGAASAEISLYGGTADTHDAFVCAPGSFNRTIAGAKMAKELGMNVRIHFCLVKTNVNEVAEMIALADGLGISYSIDPQITARYDGTRSSLDLRIDRSTLKELYSSSLKHLVPEPDCNPNRSVQCACARSVCGISATGEVYPCIGAPVPAGNLREKSFAEIWKSSPALNQIRGLKLQDFTTCQPCPHRAYCRRSSGVIYTNTGNYTGPLHFGDDWTCMEAEILHEICESGAATSQTASNAQLRRHSFEVI